MTEAVNDPVYEVEIFKGTSLGWLAILLKYLESLKSTAVTAGVYQIFSPSTVTMLSRALQSLHLNLPGLGVMGTTVHVEFDQANQCVQVNFHESYHRLITGAPDDADYRVMKMLVREATVDEVNLSRQDHGDQLQTARDRFDWYRKLSGQDAPQLPSPFVYIFANLLNDSGLTGLRLVHSAVGVSSPDLGDGESIKFTAVSSFRWVEVELNLPWAQRRYTSFQRRAFAAADARRQSVET